VDVDSPEGKVWIERLGIEFIPYVIFTKGIAETPNFFELARQNMIAIKNGEYIIPEQLLRPTGVMFFKRERRPLELELFVMSHCPVGKDAQFQISNYIEKNPGAFKVTCRYITTFREFGIDSMQGPDEIGEDIHQILIQKHHPDKFWGYLKKYREGKPFEVSCNELGISASEIMLNRDAGIALLEGDSNLCKELGISTSPTFLWEGQIIVGSMGAFRQFLSEPDVSGLINRTPTDVGAQFIAPENSRGEVTSPLPILVFYGPRCPHCHEIMNKFIPELEEEFGERIVFEYYDTSVQEHFERKMKMDEEFAVVGAAVPEIFIGDQVLVGEHEIRDKLRGVIRGLINQTPAEDVDAQVIAPENSRGEVTSLALHTRRGEVTSPLHARFKSFTPFAVAGAGLLDGVNPCAFSTIVFFLSFLTLTGFSRRQNIWVGISFTSAVFLTYLGLGLGAFIGLQRLEVFTLFSRYFDTVVGGLAILLGLVTLYDYISFKRRGDGRDMVLQLPRPVKNIIHRSIGMMRDKGRTGMARVLFIAFIVGVLVSLLESMCTGQVYLPTLTFILKMKAMWWRAFSFLLLYNVMFIVPLLAVFLLTLFGVSSGWWARVMQRNLGKVKLLTALLFFSLGIFLILL